MTKPVRAKLSARVKAAAQSIPGTTCYGQGGTEILFSDAAALIVHQGVEGDTVGDIADNVDALLGEGAFAQLSATGTYMKSDETQLDEPSQLYSLSVDPALMAKLDAERPVAPAPVETPEPAIVEAPVAESVDQEPVAEEAAAPVVDAADETPVFTEDAVFSQGAATAEAKPVAGAPEGDEVTLDLTAIEVSYATTKAGAPYATLRSPGQRTTMAFGVVAEALRGLTSATCIVSKGRSTDKIVAVRNAANDLVFEAPLAA